MAGRRRRGQHAPDDRARRLAPRRPDRPTLAAPRVGRRVPRARVGRAWRSSGSRPRRATSSAASGSPTPRPARRSRSTIRLIPGEAWLLGDDPAVRSTRGATGPSRWTGWSVGPGSATRRCAGLASSAAAAGTPAPGGEYRRTQSPAGVRTVRRSSPSDRVLAFDLARGLAVFFMILIHVMRHWGEPSTWTTPIGILASFLGGPPAAPVFMFLMGASVAFSRRSSFRLAGHARARALRARLRLQRLPRRPAADARARDAASSRPAEVAPHTPGSLLTMVDILQLAGLSLIGIAALRRFVRPGWSWLAARGGRGPRRAVPARRESSASRHRRLPERPLGRRQQRLLPGVPVGGLPARRGRRRRALAHARAIGRRCSVGSGSSASACARSAWSASPPGFRT